MQPDDELWNGVRWDLRQALDMSVNPTARWVVMEDGWVVIGQNFFTLLVEKVTVPHIAIIFPIFTLCCHIYLRNIPVAMVSPGTIWIKLLSAANQTIWSDAKLAHSRFGTEMRTLSHVLQLPDSCGSGTSGPVGHKYWWVMICHGERGLLVRNCMNHSYFYWWKIICVALFYSNL